MKTACPKSRRHGPRRSPSAPLTALVLAVAFLCAPASALADRGTTIIERCTHGKSLGGFSQQDYRRALAELPTEVEEYSDCGNVIRRAELAAAGGGAGAAGALGAVATPLTPTEQRALGAIKHKRPAPVPLGGHLVRPGVVHADVSSALSTLPNALLAVLASIAATALALGARSIRNRVWKRTAR
jgi:hypothetical protein